MESYDAPPPEEEWRDALESVVLYPAYTWTCLDCGHKEITHGLPASFSSEEEEDEIREAMGLDPSASGTIEIMPSILTCSRCLTSFNSVMPEEDLADDSHEMGDEDG